MVSKERGEEERCTGDFPDFPAFLVGFFVARPVAWPLILLMWF